MKTCEHCGRRIHREPPDTAEYGIGVVDGRRYPDVCPRCDAPLE